MEKLKQLDFNGENIRFEIKDETVMVNATEMAKVFGKRVDHFLKTDHAKSFIEVLQLPPNGGNSNFISKENIIYTNNRYGTFFNRMLALKFAAWLSPEFEVWIYRTIEELLFGHLKEMQRNIQEDARIKSEIKDLETKLAENEDYSRLENLRLQEKQVAYRRRKAVKNQLSLFDNQ